MRTRTAILLILLGAVLGIGWGLIADQIRENNCEPITRVYEDGSSVTYNCDGSTEVQGVPW